jgi:molecular chaperone GrpE (heat shock protein)
VQAVEKDELSTRAKGDVVLGLLPLVDNFELARTQVKAETEAEQKINNSYQVRRTAGWEHSTCIQQRSMHCSSSE